MAIVRTRKCGRTYSYSQYPVKNKVHTSFIVSTDFISDACQSYLFDFSSLVISYRKGMLLLLTSRAALLMPISSSSLT